MSTEQGLTPYETREILFYKTDNGEVRVEILLFQENLWLTQAKMAELFEVQKAALFCIWAADSTKPNWGLTTWKNAPKGRIRKSDVTVAKNYLNETEMHNLNEIVTMYKEIPAASRLIKEAAGILYYKQGSILRI